MKMRATLKNPVGEKIGNVQVWTGNPATSFSLDIHLDSTRTRPVASLRDPRLNQFVGPRNPRLGFNGSNAVVTCHDIVIDTCEISEEEIIGRLIAAEYRNVKPHG